MSRHGNEWVIGDTASEADVRLYTPVPLIPLQQWMIEEESRVEAAHVVIASLVGVQNPSLSLNSYARECFCWVNPVREAPPRSCKRQSGILLVLVNEQM